MNGAWGHTRRGRRRHSRTGCKGMVARGRASTPVGLERLYLETRSPIPTEKEFMFEDASGSNKGHIYGFASQFAAFIVEHQGVVAAYHRFLQYLPRQPTGPISKGRGGGGDISSRHNTSSLAS
ncbi:hypothetical protein M9H77_21645 [Catharanthus roseus]|uniref:Uncharacterized protein n=1 Tax=Catharanthus roseus TaxID=4058 RepID=A0ACC0AMW5_CATRO|nr:hypothetical protein M9H77_21645 [Catharanthus roseus]